MRRKSNEAQDKSADHNSNSRDRFSREGERSVEHCLLTQPSLQLMQIKNIRDNGRTYNSLYHGYSGSKDPICNKNGQKPRTSVVRQHMKKAQRDQKHAVCQTDYGAEQVDVFFVPAALYGGHEWKCEYRANRG